MLRLIVPSDPKGPYATEMLMKRGANGPVSEYSFETTGLPEVVFLNMEHDCFRKFLTVDPWWKEEFGLN